MMVFNFVHEDIMMLGVPKVKDYGITIINYFAQSLNVCNPVILFEGFRCSGESDFACCEYSSQIIGCVGMKIEL